ncbi:hypothetical protein DRW03_19325 [Corallococcus sp. H22C18031201]|nr:hypothetical protein DRW03_19325 [Corallococcus sp. H22C18031201]
MEWTSREHILAQLVSLLEVVPLRDRGARRLIVELIARFDPDGGRDACLLGVFLDAHERLDVREAAVLSTLGRERRMRMSREALARLASGATDETTSLSILVDLALSALVLDADAEPLAWELLLQESPAERASLLTRLRPNGPNPTLAERLFRQWWSWDRPVIEATHNERVEKNGGVALTWRRPETRDLLVRWALTLEPWLLRMWVLRELSPAEQRGLFLASPELHQRAVAALLLPVEDMVDALGAQGLLASLKKTLHEDSRAWHLTPLGVAHPKHLDDAARLLATWREARPLFHKMLCALDLATPTRRALVRALFNHDRALAPRWAREAERYPDNAPLVREVLRLVAQAPIESDRAFLWHWLRSEAAWAMAWALEGLLVLGESGAEWRARLLDLRRSNDIYVRLRAAAGLVREEVHADALMELRACARDATLPVIRAEAIRWLGAVDAEASRPFLYQAVEAAPMSRRLATREDLDEQEDDSGQVAAPVPEAEEAAAALDRLGTPEDLARLLDSRLRYRCSPEFADALARHLSRQEGRESEPSPTSCVMQRWWIRQDAADAE